MTASVLFVCVRNSGKSQMAAALMAQAAPDVVETHSAGTEPGSEINALSAQVLAEVGIDITHEQPKSIDPNLLRSVNLVITLGRDVRLDLPHGVAHQHWDTDEPSERGINGMERMRLVRDDITRRITELVVLEGLPTGHRGEPA